MRDRDDVPYIVIERETGGGVGSFLAGALLGAGLALLFAPKSGKETQEELRARAKQLKEVAEERVRDASRQLEERLDQARDGLSARVSQVKDAVESGRQAASEARHDLEDKLEKSKAAYRAGIDAARASVTAEANGDGEPSESD
jgi:gas vesicle protein